MQPARAPGAPRARAYKGSSPSIIRKQARQNVYQSIERDAARAARRYRRKVGASGSPVLASSQSAAALAGLRRLEALRRLTEADQTPRNSELKHDEDALLATRQLLRYAPEPQRQAPKVLERPARGARFEAFENKTKQLHGRPRYSVYDDPPSRHQRRPSRGTPGSGRRVTVVAAPHSGAGKRRTPSKRSRTPRSRQGSRGSRPSTATVPEDAELPPQQWPFAVFYPRPLTCERVYACVDGVDAMSCRLHAVDVASHQCRVASTPSTGEYA